MQHNSDGKLATSMGHAINGMAVLSTTFVLDGRGSFAKVLSTALHPEGFEISELFWSRSGRGVIRGMHFQREPYAGRKLVWSSEGIVRDVVLDTRSESSTFGQWNSFDLTPGSIALLIPAGVAHGFEVLSENATMNYAQECTYAPDFDAGIRYDSFNFPWITDNPILSERDMGLPSWSAWKATDR